MITLFDSLLQSGTIGGCGGITFGIIQQLILVAYTNINLHILEQSSKRYDIRFQLKLELHI